MQKDCSDSCEEVLNEISRQIVDSILKNDLIHEKETNVLTKMEDSGELIDLKKSKIDNSTAVVENGTIVVSITNGDKTDVKVYEMQDGNSKIKEDKNGNRLNQSNQEIDEADNEKISDLLVKDSNSNKINDKDNKKPESANDSDKEGKGSNKIVHTGGGDIDDLVGETFHKVITTMLTDDEEEKEQIVSSSQLLRQNNDEFKTKELEKSVPADVSSILYQPFSEKVPDFESSKFTDDFHGSQITSAVVGEAMPATERGLELELLGHKQNYIAEEVPEEFKQMDHSSKSAPPKIPPKTKSIDLSTNEVTDIAPAVAAEKEEGTQVGTKKEETKNDEIHIISNEASSLVENISDRISNIADGLRETPIFSKSEISEALINKMEQKEEEKGPTNEFINTMEELKGEVEELVASKEKEVKEFLDSKKEEMVEGMVENVVGKVDDFEKQILSGTVKEVIADEPKPPISEHLGTLFVPTESQITDSSITETTFPQSEDMKHTVIEKPDNSKTAGLEKEKKSCTLKSRTSITNGQQTSRWRRCTVL